MTILEPVPGRSVPCEACPFRTNPTFRDFSPPELEFISAFKSGELNAEVGTTLFLEDTNSPHLLHGVGGLGVPLQDAPGRPPANSEFRAAGGFPRPADVGVRQDGTFGGSPDRHGVVHFSARETVGVVQRPSEPELRCHLACRARGAGAR